MPSRFSDSRSVASSAAKQNPPVAWQIADRADRRHALDGRLAAGETTRVAVAPPVRLGNRGGTVTLLDGRGLKVDGVACTADQAGREGRG